MLLSILSAGGWIFVALQSFGLSLSIWHSRWLVCVCVCVRRHKTVCGEKRAPRPVKNNVYLFVCSLAYECVRMIVYGKIHTLGVSEWKQKYIKQIYNGSHLYTHTDTRTGTKRMNTCIFATNSAYAQQQTNKQTIQSCTQTLPQILLPVICAVPATLYSVYRRCAVCMLMYESEHSTNKIIFRFVSSLAVFASATFSKLMKIHTYTHKSAHETQHRTIFGFVCICRNRKDVNRNENKRIWNKIFKTKKCDWFNNKERERERRAEYVTISCYRIGILINTWLNR